MGYQFGQALRHAACTAPSTCCALPCTAHCHAAARRHALHTVMECAAYSHELHASMRHALRAVRDALHCAAACGRSRAVTPTSEGSWPGAENLTLRLYRVRYLWWSTSSRDTSN